MCVCVRVCVCVCVRVCVCVVCVWCVCVCVRACVCMCVHFINYMCIQTHDEQSTRTYMYMYNRLSCTTCTYMHMQIYMYNNTHRQSTHVCSVRVVLSTSSGQSSDTSTCIALYLGTVVRQEADEWVQSPCLDYCLLVLSWWREWRQGGGEGGEG